MKTTPTKQKRWIIIATSLFIAIMMLNPSPSFAKKSKNKTGEPTIEEVIIEHGLNFEDLDIKPKFKGGDFLAFRKWVMTNVRYPANAQNKGISGRVLLSFFVEKNGSVSSIELLKDPDKNLSAEAMRVVKSSPRWTPAELNGEKVRVKFIIPVVFSLDTKSE